MLSLSHKKLNAYAISLQLLKEICQLTSHFPASEKHVLVSQLRRAAVSVSSNIAKGAARKSKPEKKRFFEIARSSAVEIDTQLEIALLLQYAEYVNMSVVEPPIKSVFRMLSRMIENLEASG